MRHFTALMVFVFAFCLMAEARVRPMEECPPQFSIFNSQSSIFNSQSSIFNFQFSILRGDANGDGEVNISDVMLLVNRVLGAPTSVFIAANCDMNSDGDINVSDVSILINLILEGDSQMGPGDAEDPDVNGN